MAERFKFFTTLCMFSVLLVSVCAHADEASLVTALQDTYVSCVGIDDELYELKKMAGSLDRKSVV